MIARVDLNHRSPSRPPSPTPGRPSRTSSPSRSCFPGATVTEVDGDDFKGTVQGQARPDRAGLHRHRHLHREGRGRAPVRRRRQGQGQARQRHRRRDGHRDLRRATAPAPPGSTCITDLAITGKPAQFGRGVMQDVSDKLLQQFVTCLQDKVGTPRRSRGSGGRRGRGAGAGRGRARPGGRGGPGQADRRRARRPPVASARPSAASSSDDDALDLGATVLPILAGPTARRSGSRWSPWSSATCWAARRG